MSGDVPSRSRRRAGFVPLAAVPLALAGCGGNQNVLDPHSHAEHRISVLWWVMMTGAWIGFGVVGTLLLLGWLRRNRPSLPFGGGERAATGLVIGLGIGVPIIVLSTLFVWSDIFVIRSTAAPSRSSTSLTIRVSGHQWWWEARYPGTNVVTANEIHIPTKTRVNVVGTTSDVIHSLWVPELNRKIDLIPGRTNRVLLYADRPGTYAGQCAEFCGLQHAHMTVFVVAQPPSQFRSWLRDIAAPARAPTGADAVRGEQVFLDEACSGCHQIRGTPARGQVGPDLTHVASRTTLAAGAIPNDPKHLADWIRDPQDDKPGSKMPGLQLKPAELRALVAYLEGLR
jgi:cytochrome c oxidase subunit 2